MTIYRDAPHRAAYSYVVHDSYGCESGCCGHIAYLCDENDNIIAQSDFEFCHPGRQPYDEWAKEFCLELWPDVPVKLAMCEVSDA
jgi:hypothetical protein